MENVPIMCVRIYIHISQIYIFFSMKSLEKFLSIIVIEKYICFEPTLLYFCVIIITQREKSVV